MKKRPALSPEARVRELDALAVGHFRALACIATFEKIDAVSLAEEMGWCAHYAHDICRALYRRFGMIRVESWFRSVGGGKPLPVYCLVDGRPDARRPSPVPKPLLCAQYRRRCKERGQMASPLIMQVLSRPIVSEQSAV